LANSTISHHLGLLMLEGIVSVKRIENRNYFSLEKERLESLLARTLKRMLNVQN